MPPFVDGEQGQIDENGRETENRDIHMDRDEETTLLTPSMTSRMFAYRNGRRYSAQSTSTPLLPNDEEEIYRLELQHKAVLRSLGGLHSFPEEKFERVLDAGCGPGWWAVDFADAHPDCDVLGVDIVPIQPQEIPPNLSFECDDICQGLRFPDGHFDVVYSRNLCASIIDWQVYLKELYRVLKPGGYLNCVECDLAFENSSLHHNTALYQWNAGIIKLYEHHRLNPNIATNIKALMMQVGWSDVEEQHFEIPGGNYPRSSGAEQETAQLMTEVNMLNLSALSSQYGVANDIHDEDLDLFVSEVRRDLVNPDIDWRTGWVSCIGKKK